MMMPPNSVISIARGNLEELDAGGDPIEVDSITIAEGIPALIAVTGTMTESYTSGTPRQVSTFECYVDPGTDVQAQDRIIDQAAVTYHVLSVNQLPSYGMFSDIQIRMFQVTGA